MRPQESRVLVVAPVGQDAEAMGAMLRSEGVTAEACAGAEECLASLEGGAGAVLLTEEALELRGAEELLESFRRQPAWSELPLIILTSGGESRFARLLEIAAEVAGVVTLLERPMRTGTLLQSVRVALRSRRRQYEVRDLLAERERREGALTESHKRLERVVETQTVGVMFWDLSTGCMVDANETFLSLMGYSRREVEARELTWEKLTPPEYLEVSRAEIRKFQATGRVGPYEKEYFRKDGTRLWLLFAGSSLGNSECVEFCVDISDRKKAEAALRQANERLSYHVQNTPLAVVEFDAELKVCAWSGGAERMFGWKAAEVLGRRMWEVGWICEEDRGKVEQVSAGLRGGQTARSVSPNRNLRKDGGVIWCEWYNSSIMDDSGRMQSILSLVLDVTQRKEAEAVLARDKEQLERLVAERTAALRELVGELEHFSYSITHDMRAPLRAMMGFAEVAKELCSGCPQQEQKMFLDRIQTGARRMDLLITDALNYSKAVRSELPLAPVDVGRLLRGMLDTYPELQGAQEGIRIEPELPLVMGNEAGLTQCFSNLLVNAVKFAKPGEAPGIRVWSEVGAEGDGWVRIWVEDRGIGIGQNMLPRVFDMFARGASEQAGTGIGLALVRKVVQRMGGRVGAESEAGQGSRFWVELRSGDVRGRAGG